jgi:hypothetical protein
VVHKLCEGLSRATGSHGVQHPRRMFECLWTILTRRAKVLSRLCFACPSAVMTINRVVHPFSIHQARTELISKLATPFWRKSGTTYKSSSSAFKPCSRSLPYDTVATPTACAPAQAINTAAQQEIRPLQRTAQLKLDG